MSNRVRGRVAPPRWRLLLAGLLLAASPCWAQGGAAPAPGVAAQLDGRQAELGMAEWLLRIHEASRRRAYIGTFVVSSGPVLSSARIWHICDGEQQMQRVESLSGVPRSTFRRNDQVITFLPETKTAIAEKRESLGLFPELLKSAASPIAQHYSVRRVGVERVAGLDSDVVLLQPKDDLRFGYRVWNEKKSGLVVKLQTLDAEGRVLEQAAFSELQLDAPVSFGKLTQMMENTDGYRVERPEFVKTTALAEGWSMRAPVAGFLPMSCYKRPAAVADGHGTDTTMQWIFSDGLASVSIFVEQFDRKRHAHEGSTTVGATNTLSRRFADKAGEWWLTVVGEVPRHTLIAFAQGLERKK
ncbi:MAG: MucB/RseB C-terminal domain-containing protein [Burkholderiaceae bacterium]